MIDYSDFFFFNSVCVPLVQYYRSHNDGNGDPFLENILLDPKSTLVLDKIWVNYQYKTEFNPYHENFGVYSLAIWLKIPYDWNTKKINTISLP